MISIRLNQESTNTMVQVQRVTSAPHNFECLAGSLTACHFTSASMNFLHARTNIIQNSASKIYFFLFLICYNS